MKMFKVNERAKIKVDSCKKQFNYILKPNNFIKIIKCFKEFSLWCVVPI